MSVDERKLGRLPSVDSRDRMHLMALQPTARRYRYWPAYRWKLDQGFEPQCVAFSWAHFLVDSPITLSLGAQIEPNPATLYHEAQKVDEWPGEGYAGTSVRAGAKVLQSLGRIGEYQWAFNLSTIIYQLLEIGPVVVGTNWYTSMFDPDPVSHKISINGDVVGGHAYKLDGINLNTGFVRLKNSWGESWGNRGFARMSLDDLWRLIAEDGEACKAVEIKV